MLNLTERVPPSPGALYVSKWKDNMIDLLEKIVAGVCALLILVTIAVYGFFKLPSAKPLWSLQGVKEVRVETANSSRTSTPGKTPTVSPEIQAVIQNLAKQERRVSASQLQVKTLEVPQPLFEHLAAEANLLPALKTAKSRVLKTKNGDTRLQVFNIKSQSYLQKLGFKDNDIVELVDGQILEFSESASARYYEVWNDAKAKLRNGEPISVTVTRGGKPVHLKFRL